jgi:hypothetical protein
MGSPEWCCPYKNDFFSHFGKRYDRVVQEVACFEKESDELD